MSAARTSAFTTSKRVVDWIHGYAADFWTAPKPTVSSGFAERDILVGDIAYLSNCSSATCQDFSDFT
jgi:hypothetical protein